MGRKIGPTMWRLFLMSLLLMPSTLLGQGPRAARIATLPVQPVPTAPAPQRLDPVYPPADELGMGLGGLLAGITGVVAGGFAGAVVERGGGCDGDWCGFAGAVHGAAAGSAVMVPVGVHLTNRRRGNLGRAMLYSLGVTAVGVAVAHATDDGIPILLIPLAQIVVSVAAETATTDTSRP